MGEWREPDLIGAVGCAWLSRCEPATPPQRAELACYLIRRRAETEWWMLAVVHLRPIDGDPAPPKAYPGAQYELIISDLAEPPSDADSPHTFYTPPVVCAQFDGVSDAHAPLIAEAVVSFVLMGDVGPPDGRLAHWRAAVAGSVMAFASAGSQTKTVFCQ